MALGALPDDAVKGGSSLKIRYGNQTICFTRDLYTARIRNLDDSFKNSKTPSSQDGGPYRKSRSQNTRYRRRFVNPSRHETFRNKTQL